MSDRPRHQVHLPEGAYSWPSQVWQYRDAPPPAEPGITYFAGVLPGFRLPVDCLLYWEWNPARTRLRIVGILNHYPQDYGTGPGSEQRGNVNVWVRRSHQRRGIGTALYDEAVRRWRVRLEAQRFTDSGARFADYLSERPAPGSGSPGKG